MVAVISKTSIRLMPTKEYRARRLLKNGKAVIEKYHPFTIRLTEREDGDVQPIEYACDTGYQHVGVSTKSEKHGYLHAQFDMLQGETERHNDCRKFNIHTYHTDEELNDGITTYAFGWYNNVRPHSYDGNVPPCKCAYLKVVGGERKLFMEKRKKLQKSKSL